MPINTANPISLRVSLTDHCQLRCRYCRPAHAVLPPPGAVAPWETWFRRICAVADTAPLKGVRFTGGEPLLYPQLVPLIEACADRHLPDLAMTTNGFRLADTAHELYRAGLDRVNISLDALDPTVFRQMTGARPEKVIEAVDASLETGLRVKVNAVILRGINDREMASLIRFAAERGITVRFLEMMPMGPAARDFGDCYISGREMMDRLSGEFRFEPLPYQPGETSRDFRVTLPDGTQAVCGFILPTSTPFCAGCRRIRLLADGRLMGCLAQPDALELDSAVEASAQGDPLPMEHLLTRAFAMKGRSQQFEDQPSMVRIGG